MSFTVPKSMDLNSLSIPEVIDVDLNDVDVDRLMTKILELAVKQGRRTSSVTDTTDYDRYLDALQRSEHLTGFEGPRGRDVLDGWLRTAVVRMDAVGRARGGPEHMGYLRPLTLAAYRSGLPKNTRSRRADTLVYRCLIRTLRADGSQNPRADLKSLIVGTFGRAVDLGPPPSERPGYDGNSDVDIDTLLALRFLEGFEQVGKTTTVPEDFDPPVPQAVDPLGRDLVDYLRFYGPALPISEAYAHFAALISLRLFQLPLVTAHHLRAMLEGRTPETAEFYCDFIGRARTMSDQVSDTSVRRDLETLNTFLRDRSLIKLISQAITPLPECRRTPDQDAATWLARLVALRDDPRVQFGLGMTLQHLEHAARMEHDEDGAAFLAGLRGSNADRLLAALEESNGAGRQNQLKWFWHTGGIEKSYGLLAGNRSSKPTWRYAPAEECLIPLLCLAFVEPGGTGTADRLPIRVVLDRLADRFGVLVDRPPRALESADARSGAGENLAAFTRQLQLLGCYQGLSDDFDARFVTRPRKAVR